MTVPSKDGQRIRSMFDNIAPRYDLMNRVITLGQDQRWRRFAVSRAELANGDTVLDLAAGTGDIAFEVKRRFPLSEVTAGDFSPRMLEVGQSRRGGDQIDWVVCDAMALPFADRSFDAVLFGYLLRNVADIDQALGEIHRVLKPGGRVVCLDTTPPKAGLLRPAILLYLKYGLPLLGRLIAGSGGSYAYLSQSTLSFATPDDLCMRFEQSGFTRVTFKTFLCHTVAVHWGTKPAGT